MSTGQPLPVPPDLVAAFWGYEHALMSDDLAALDLLFAPGPSTLRGDAGGLLVGHDQIAAFRGGRGGAPRRRIVQTHVQVVDADHAVVVAVTELDRGGRGLQTQVWARTERLDGSLGWAVTAAHVSVPPPAIDTRVWRVLGDPLVRATGPGALVEESIAVKDLYAVAGHRTGAGNPTWLAEATPATEHARVVADLLAAGAVVTGITRTDELAYSLAGTNAHSGTPPNPRAGRRIPGGSTSGAATAVSLGQASIGLGTDTGGSIRVPAAYQGLWGLRTTHGLVDTEGLVPLAPSFDTVGWLTRSPELLLAVGEVLLPRDAASAAELGEPVLLTDLVALAEPDVAAAIGRWADEHDLARDEAGLDELGPWLAAFQTVQAREAWQQHGPWLTGRLDVLGPDVRARFRRASETTAEQAAEARAVVDEAHRRIRSLVAGRVLVLPSASSVAPELGPGLADRLQAVRDATMRLTCVAGIGGLPGLGIPLATREGLPCGACLVGPAGSDLPLLRLATQLRP